MAPQAGQERAAALTNVTHRNALLTCFEWEERPALHARALRTYGRPGGSGHDIRARARARAQTPGGSGHDILARTRARCQPRGYFLSSSASASFAMRKESTAAGTPP